MVGVLATGLLLGGCGGDPKAEPSPSPSPPVSSTPTPAPPALPPAATANTKAGAIAFVKHYIDLINYAQATGDVAPLKAESSNTCKSCNSVSEVAQSIYAEGGHISGGRWRIKAMFAVAAEPGWIVTARINFGPQVVRKTDSAAEQNLGGGTLLLNVHAKRMHSGWEVSSWDRSE